MFDPIILMGHTNTRDGDISAIAAARAHVAASLAQKAPERFRIIPTGAFGNHFNSTGVPHGDLLHAYLITLGVSPHQVWPTALGDNTMSDAEKAKEVIASMQGSRSVHVVSSDFHMSRVAYIFLRVFDAYELHFYAAPTIASSAELQQLLRHELSALQLLGDREG